MSKDSKMITLKSSDGQVFVVERTVALESQTIKHMIEDACTDNDIPIPNVTGKILAMVIEYCKKRAEAVATGDNAIIETSFGSEFIKVDQATLFDLILAADYLNIKSLLNLTCQSVAEMIRGKYPWEIREIFNIKNDFNRKEEDEIRRENAWAFE